MINVLFVDSDPESCSVVSSVLRARIGVDVQVAESVRDAMDQIMAGGRFDVVVSESETRDGEAVELFEFLIHRGTSCCFFLYTEQRQSVEYLARFQHWNFCGTIRKSALTNLCGAIVFSVETASLVTKLSYES